MARTHHVFKMYPHPRDPSCPCDTCNEDLLVFSDDETVTSTTSTSTRRNHSNFDAHSDTATVGIVNDEYAEYDDYDYEQFIEHKEFDICLVPNFADPFHPGNKGDATWDGETIYTSDGWVLTVRPISPDHYENIKGIDLVRWFTENYIKEQKDKEERRLKKLAVAEAKAQAAVEAAILNKKLKAQARRRRNKEKKKPSKFLSLPPELRTLIYSYAIPESRILVRGNSPGKLYTQLKSQWNSDNEYIKKPRYVLGHRLDKSDIINRLEVTSALLSVNKQIKHEVGLFMYAQLNFCFDSTKVLRKFIDRTPAEALKAIKKLELLHIEYGEPKLTQHNRFNWKDQRNWREICQVISEEMLSLQKLKLNIKICQWPVTLREDDHWFQAAMELVKDHKMEDVEVALLHSNSSIREDRLERASIRLANQMMTPEGKFRKEEKEANLLIKKFQNAEAVAEAVAEAARLASLRSLPPMLTKSVLRIVLNDDASGSSSSTTPKKYVKSNTVGYNTNHLNDV